MQALSVAAAATICRVLQDDGSRLCLSQNLSRRPSQALALLLGGVDSHGLGRSALVYRSHRGGSRCRPGRSGNVGERQESEDDGRVARNRRTRVDRGCRAARAVWVSTSGYFASGRGQCDRCSRDSKYNICQLERAQGRLSTWSTSGNQSLQSRPAAGKKGVFNSSSPAIDTFALQHVL